MSMQPADMDTGNFGDAEAALKLLRIQIAVLKRLDVLPLTFDEASWLLAHIIRWEFPADLQRGAAERPFVSEYMPLLHHIRQSLEQALQSKVHPAAQSQSPTVDPVLPNVVTQLMIVFLSRAYVADDENRIWYPYPVLGSAEDVAIAHHLAEKLETILLDPQHCSSTLDVDEILLEDSLLTRRIQSQTQTRAWKMALAQVLHLDSLA